MILPGRHVPRPVVTQTAANSHTPPPAIQTSRTALNGVQEPNTVRYRFIVKAEQVREICLAGDFNQWKVCDAPLSRVAEGVWSITIDLPRGRHEYMFVIDGKWVTDPNAMGYSTDGFGNRNALLVV
jgi:1,4-alpha-glucan branching enzyme